MSATTDGRATADATAVLDAAEDDTPEAALGSPRPGRRKLKRRTTVALAVIGVAAVVIGAVIGVRLVTDARNFVTTNNATVDGTQIVVSAPASGTLTNWTVQLGSEVRANQTLGRVAVPAGYSQPQVAVRAPASGVVAVNNGVNGAFVAAGTQLAIAYDESAVFVTARVVETDIADVHVGKAVDVSVDAFPGTTLTGRVAEIKTGAAGVFSLFPQSNSSGNFQKVTQVIPVTIAIDDKAGLALVPGMNVTVKIHKQ